MQFWNIGQIQSGSTWSHLRAVIHRAEEFSHPGSYRISPLDDGIYRLNLTSPGNFQQCLIHPRCTWKNLQWFSSGRNAAYYGNQLLVITTVEQLPILVSVHHGVCSVGFLLGRMAQSHVLLLLLLTSMLQCGICFLDLKSNSLWLNVIWWDIRSFI